MSVKFAWVIICVFLLQVGLAEAAGNVDLDISVSGDNYTVNQTITGEISVTYDYFIRDGATMRAYVDDLLKSELVIDPFLMDSGFVYKDVLFGYKLKSSGSYEWVEYPEEDFTYTITGTGTCGSASCAPNCLCTGYCTPPTSPPYYCEWSVTTSPSTGTVIGYPFGNYWLKGLANASQEIVLPPHNNGDTIFTASVTNPHVALTLMAACGNDVYAEKPPFSGYVTSNNGWITRTLNPSTWDTSPPTGRKTNIEPFYHNSLGSERSKFNNGIPIGGIYKDDVYLKQGTDVVWDGDTGYIEIKSFSSSSVYKIVFLPPHGDIVCAYTDHNIPHIEQWTKEGNEITATAKFGSPFNKTHAVSEFPGKEECPHDPPGILCKNNPDPSIYTATKTSGAVNFVALFNDVTKLLTITASTDSRAFITNYTDDVQLEEFDNLVVESEGEHELKIQILKGIVLAEETVNFGICHDADADGYCGENDCNDNSSNIHPNAPELCNGVDDDCDGSVDEDFKTVDSHIGEPCGFGACQGVYVCTSDGSDVVCNNTLGSGQNREICSNGIDDDCDGVPDEELECTGRDDYGACVNYSIACWCQEGSTQECGGVIGICSRGIRTCEYGVWGECVRTRGPSTEVCNQLDDDCDGSVDNVNGGKSKQATKCGCFGGSQPSTEICNDIDDNCDGSVDEGLTCCSSGDTRACGTETGTCREGIQSCVNGKWGECTGQIEPVTEICSNTEDDNCNGQVNEGCPDYILLCQNGIQDDTEDGIDCGGACPNICESKELWVMMILAGLAIIIIVVILAGYMKSQGRELTWSELSKKWNSE